MKDTHPGVPPLLGGSGLASNPYSGLRLTVGGSLTPNGAAGIEGSGFMMEQRTTGYSSFSYPAGNPSPPASNYRH
jgi:hypothetical protein